MSLPTYFPLRWESTGDQWWYVSPIDWAAANGHYDVVRELLRLDGNHLIKLASLRRIRRLETVWDDEEQFHHVASCRSDVAKKLLSESDSKKGKNSLIGSGYGGWLIYTAASAGDLDFVRELLERDPLLVFGEGEYGVTDVLYAAARSKDGRVFKEVLDFAASPRLPAAAGGHDCGGQVPAAYKFEIMNRALHAAARGGNVKLLKELLSDCSDDAVDYRDRQGATILHAAAARGQVEVVTDLLLTSSDILTTSADNHGNTPLHVAAHRGHLPVVESLILASPSSINATNHDGDTFLHAVITGFRTPCFRRMDLQIDLMKHLLTGKLFNIDRIINFQNRKGRTALHLAVAENVHSDLVEHLMAVDSIDINIRDADGWTPLDILRRQPESQSSELLTRQLISAGGIFTSQDYLARKVIASHLKKQSIGSSPGTSFKISDGEILLHTGLRLENPSEIPRPKLISPQFSPKNGGKIASIHHPAAQGLKWLLFHLPKMRNRTSAKLKKLVDGTCATTSVQVHVPLRQRFSNNYNNKRPLSVRSNFGSPAPKKRLASHKSRSSSFTKMSFSSHNSAGVEIDNDIAKASTVSVDRHGFGTKTKRVMMKQYLCFGGQSQHIHIGCAPAPGDLETYDIYEQTAA